MIYGFNAGEAFKIAIAIEENGRIFYEKAQAATEDADVRQVFKQLGLAEVEHKKRFTDLMAGLPASSTESTVWDPDNEIDQYLKMMADMHVFRKSDEVEARLGDVSDTVSALKLAIQFEKDSIVFFTEMQNLAGDGESRDQIGQLANEERQHLKILTIELNKITG